MVKFSDLKKDPQSPVNQARPRGGEKGASGSGLSFSQLDRARGGATFQGISREKPRRAEDREALYEKAVGYLDQVFEIVKKRQRFSLEAGIQIIREVAADTSHGDPILIKAIHSDDPEKFIVKNCVNVAIIALKTAQNLGFTPERQIKIGLAGLLHEVGMGVIPGKLIYAKDELTAQEAEIFKKRTEYGYKILSEFGPEYSFLAETILQIHERIDGSGYPAGLRGDEIGEFAQIIGLVDQYEALIHSRPQREKLLYFAAAKEIIKTGKRGFHKKYIKALLNTCSIFPVDSYVQLNSNAIGRVIETYPEHPMKPKLQVVYDSQGHRVLTERIVDLNVNSILFIVDSVPKEYLQQLARGLFITNMPISAHHVSSVCMA